MSLQVSFFPHVNLTKICKVCQLLFYIDFIFVEIDLDWTDERRSLIEIFSVSSGLYNGYDKETSECDGVLQQITPGHGTARIKESCRETVLANRAVD